MSTLSPTEKISIEVQGHCAVLTLKNPPAHVWTRESLAAMPKIIQALNADSQIYSLILRGEGEKFFCAGADLKMFQDGDKKVAAEVADLFNNAMKAIQSFEGVSVAAINGYAMGGGLEAALACDLRVADEHAQMALPEAAVGLLPCGHGTQSLAWTVGLSWAKRMILCGERLDAKKALSIGLVDEVLPKGEAFAYAQKLCSQVESQSPSSVKACKKLISASLKQSPWQNLDAEGQAFVDLFDTQDQKEGVAAFLEKRKAQWKNA